MNRNRAALRWLLLAIIILSFSGASFSQIAVGISVRIGPPPLPVYAQPICPGPGYFWTPGYWAWNDDDGYYWVLGRVDDVMNVSGHRLSTMEIESALVHHAAVAEAAVVGKPHEITGQAVCAFVTLKKGNWDPKVLQQELRQWVGHEIGPFARFQWNEKDN